MLWFTQHCRHHQDGQSSKLQSHKVGYINLDVSYDYRNDELYYMPVIEKRLAYKTGAMAVGLVLIATGAESEYQRVGIFSNDAGDKATELCFLFKPPTYPRSEADISAKFEIETQFEKLTMATKQWRQQQLLIQVT